MGEDGWTGALLVAPTPIIVKMVWDRLLPPAAPLLAMAQGPPLLEARDRMPKYPNIAREALQIGRTQVPSSPSGPRFGPHGLGMCYPSKNFKPVLGELRICG